MFVVVVDFIGFVVVRKKKSYKTNTSNFLKNTPQNPFPIRRNVHLFPHHRPRLPSPRRPLNHPRHHNTLPPPNLHERLPCTNGHLPLRYPSTPGRLQRSQKSLPKRQFKQFRLQFRFQSKDRRNQIFERKLSFNRCLNSSSNL